MPINYCPKCETKLRFGKSTIISYDKGVKCSVCDWKAEKPKYRGTPPPNKKVYLSLTEILWDELKEKFINEKVFKNGSCSSTEWEEYQIKLIKKSQGE